ncbi:MAG: PqqD family protein [Thermovirgaceae bacterium]
MHEDILVRNSGLVWSDLEEDTVLLDADAGTYYTLNEVAASVWEKIDGKRTIGDIVELMLEEYDVERATLERDMEDLVADLEDKGLVERKKTED